MADKQDTRIEDLTAQLAATQVRIDTLESELAEAKSRADKAEGERDGVREQIAKIEKERADGGESPAKLKEQIKALAGKVTRLEKERNDALSPERVRDAVKARVALETQAMQVMGGRDRFDEMTDRQLLEAAIERMTGSKVDANKSDDYVRSRFDTLIEGHAKTASKIEEVRESLRKDDSKDEPERKDARKTPRQKFLEEMDNMSNTTPAQEAR